MLRGSLILLSMGAIFAVAALAACGGASSPANNAVANAPSKPADTAVEKPAPEPTKKETPKTEVDRAPDVHAGVQAINGYYAALKANDAEKALSFMAATERDAENRKIAASWADRALAWTADIGAGRFDTGRVLVPVTFTWSDGSRPTQTITLVCTKDGDAWRISEVARKAAARGFEAQAVLKIIKDRLRISYVQNNNALRAGLRLEDLVQPKDLIGKYYGTYALQVKGTKDDGYAGTTITSTPLSGVDALVLTLTFESVVTGNFKISPDIGE